MYSEYVEVLKLCKCAIESAIASGQMQKRKVISCIGKTTAKKRAKYFNMFSIKKKTKEASPEAENVVRRAQKYAKVLTKFGRRSKENKGTILLVLYVIGGIGLNLTGCHYGIFMEPLFNPQAELQAADRMYAKICFYISFLIMKLY